MEVFTTCSLAILEMTFIFVGLLILHGLRDLIGKASFYIAMGLLLVFTQLVSAAELKVIVGYPGGDFYIASSVLFLPYLAAIMIIYITEGTLMTQRFIIGAMATLGLYLYLSNLTSLQCSWPGYSIAQGPTADSLDYLLRQSQRTMAGSILAQALDLFMIPIFFQRLRNLKCRLFIAVLGALMLTQMVDALVYVTAVYWARPQWWLYINSSYIAKAVSTVWLSMLATIYISRIEKEIPGEGRGTLDIVFAFFGGYGKAKELQQNIAEWEGRYGVVVEHASDMILLLNKDGTILDANLAALAMFGLDRREELVGRSFHDIVLDINESSICWDDYMKPGERHDNNIHVQRMQCSASSGGKVVELDVALSSVEVEKVPMLIVFGRDVTRQNTLAREKEELREQLVHTQRLESVGKLAGGVAHDFNNYVHAILGHVDVIKYMHDVKDKKVVSHLDKIGNIAESAGELTQQLLGFARKGKYVEREIDLGRLLNETGALFVPTILEGMVFDVDAEESAMSVKGDPVQLQQVFLNMLINARDALESRSGEKQLTIKAGNADDFKVNLNPPSDLSERHEKYYCVKISDNGYGIDKLTIDRIFEPFFTTKPIGKGTGMGLAMAYGTISNHHGWIQVVSSVGKGTTFYTFLPCLATGIKESPENSAIL